MSAKFMEALRRIDKAHPFARVGGEVGKATYEKGKELVKMPKGEQRKSQRSFMQLYRLVGPTARGYKVGSSGSKVRYKKTGGKAGRPKGTYKYNIPGKGAVDVYTFRRWKSRQRALERLQGPNQQFSANLPTSSAETQYTQERPLPLSQSQVAPPSNIFQESQGQDSGNILHAPNVFRGELRNVGMNDAVPDVDRLHKPIANVDGDYYTDVDPMSGRPLLRKRIRERWLSG